MSAEYLNSDSAIAVAMRQVIGTFMVEITQELHPSTEPEEIARDQRRVIRGAYRAGYQTPEALSEVVHLPLWVVRRRLGELGYGPVVGWVKAVHKPKRTVTQSVFAGRK